MRMCRDLRHSATPCSIQLSCAKSRRRCSRLLLARQGSFYAPTVISGATTDMKIFREETFGPAIPLFKFSKDEEAVQLANNTEYGLAAYFFTKVSAPALLASTNSHTDKVRQAVQQAMQSEHPSSPHLKVQMLISGGKRVQLAEWLS